VVVLFGRIDIRPLFKVYYLIVYFDKWLICNKKWSFSMKYFQEIYVVTIDNVILKKAFDNYDMAEDYVLDLDAGTQPNAIIHTILMEKKNA
jgi:hypothetical protein